jgi:16S rRNA (guanine527-N7)-methyltransferase
VTATPDAGDRLRRLVELIAAAPHNLVSRRERGTLADVHVPECLGVGRALTPEPGSRWMDLGTGGGLPGLVLAIAWPQASWTLVDGTAKKIAAVGEFAAALGLENVATISGRAETLARAPDLRGAFDGVVSRALARLVVAVELSRGFVRPGGRIACVKGPRWREEVAEAEPALPGLAVAAVGCTPITDTARATVLVTMRAAGPVPDDVPRRDGVPAAKPRSGRESTP